MKYTYFNTASCLFLLLAFVTACSGPSDSKVVDSKPSIVPFTPEATPQIAEYVVDIYEDKSGNLWFGTMAKGVARYDGKTLTYLSAADGLAGNVVPSIAQDQEGNLWFGTHTGASKYDGTTFVNYSQTEGLSGMGCQILVDQKGNIWAGTNHGVFRYDGKVFTPFKLPNPIIEHQSYKWELGKVWSLIEDRQGNIWFARDGYGACKFDGTTFTHFTKKDGLCSNMVSSIWEDKWGNIWFGALSSDFPSPVNEGGLSRYDGETIIQFPDLEGLSKSDIYAIGEDEAGNIWVGAIGFGAYRIEQSEGKLTGEKFTVFKETDRKDLTSRFALQSILADKKGRFWLGFSGGLFRLREDSIINVTQYGPWE